MDKNWSTLHIFVGRGILILKFENGMIKLKSTYIEDDAIELTNGTDPACNMLNLNYKK